MRKLGKNPNKQNELALYKKALRDYKLSRFLPKVCFNTHFGFCCYFGKGLPPILGNMKPKKTYDGYWFPKGALEPRIKLLEEAIKICKTNKI